MNLFPKMYGEDRVGLFILIYVYCDSRFSIDVSIYNREIYFLRCRIENRVGLFILLYI